MRTFTLKTVLPIFCTMFAFITTVVAQQRATDTFEYRNNCRINVKTGVVAARYNIKSPVYQGSPEQIAKQYLDENKAIFGISNVTDLKPIQTIESPSGKHITFLQTYQGIPVFGTETVVSINKNNRITMVVNGNTDITDLKSTNADISSEKAIEKAFEKVNVDESTLIALPRCDLYIYQDSLSCANLAWKVNFGAGKPPGDWQIFIDAISGEVLKIEDISVNYVNGQGKVFNPDPISSLSDASLTDQNDADYQELQGAYKTVTLTNLNDPVGGVFCLQGKYAKSVNKQYPDYTPVTSTTPSFNYNRSQLGFEEVNIYYHLNTIREYIGSLGFHPQFEDQGILKDYICFDAHDYTGSHYSTWGYITLGDGCVDAGEDQDVVAHEYGHAIHDAFMAEYGFSGDQLGVSEGIGDYLAISYRRTLSSFQPDKIFPWDGNGESWSGRALEADYNYYDNWLFPPDGLSSEEIIYMKGTLWASTMMDVEENGSIGRNIATTLLLDGVSHVSISSPVHDVIYGMLQADRDLYDGEHLTILLNIFDQRGFFDYGGLTEESGTISSNTSWTDRYIYVSGDVTVNSGITLEIDPGVFVFFNDDTRLTINGTLIAEGTAEDPIVFTSYNENPASSNWYGIRFEDSSVDASCKVKYCDIKYAQYGIYCNRANPRIQNNSISHSNYGIYLYQSSPAHIETNTVINNSEGIHGTSSSPTITDNLLRDNSYAGIYFSGGSPKLYDNTIDDNYFGAYIISGSSPEFGPIYTSDKGNNVITENSFGIYAQYYSDPFMGSHGYYPGARIGGYNSICDNYNRDATAYFYTDIEAEYNWWGSSPVRLASYGSSINYSFALGSDPGGGSSLGKSVVIAENNDKWAGFDPDNPDLNNVNDLWLLGYYHFINNQLEESIEAYQMLVNKFSDDNFANRALVKIYHLYHETGKDGLDDYLNGLLKNSAIDENVHQMVYSLLLNVSLDNKDVSSAQKICEAIMGKYPDSIAEKTAIYAMVLAMLNDLNDIEKASQYTEVMIQKYPDDDLTYMTREAMGEKVNWPLDKPVVEPEIADIQLPERYALHNNYPNPFNPVTNIRYQLPVAGKVKLQVFDLTGRLIRILVDENKPAGDYTVTWNARNVSSGIYFYRIEAGEFSLVKKCVKLK
ncbi:right-handed parallel beta-helix repeat-containing protein [bacterium]|nr:right-handed parallel beta-helix repeat-containing protein [bacterium]MBU1634600.1 right-handed parallel beta-helix repeat-containing protein [bacterium]MBU1872239.1 right-handed parallel beta-helix repeat-containing protein [bacterium]